MARTAALTFERMEDRTLLSGLVQTITTSQSVYQLGQPVEITFTEANTSDQPISVFTDGLEGRFDIRENGALVWVVGNGAESQSFGSAELGPGQSTSWTVSWNGVLGNGAPKSAQDVAADASSEVAPGTFTVSSEYDPEAEPAVFQIASPLSYQLNVQTSTELIDTSTISYVITNNSTSAVSFVMPPTEFQIVNSNSVVITDTNSNAADEPSVDETLQPGQSITEAANWNSSSYLSSISGESATEQEVAEDLNVVVPGGPSGLETAFSVGQTPVTLIDSPLQVTFATQAPSGSANLIITATVSAASATELFNLSDVSGEPPASISVYSPTDALIITEIPSQSVSTGAGVTTDPMTLTAIWPEGISEWVAGDTVTLTDGDQSVTAPLVLSVAPVSTSTVSTTAPVTSSVSASEPTYQIGKSVPLAVSLTNDSTSNVNLSKPETRIEITILDGSTVVWKKTEVTHLTKAKVLKAGRSMEAAFVWNGKPNQPGVKKLAAGTYTVEVNDDGYLAQTSIELVGRASAFAKSHLDVDRR